jgi:LysM repeat protein
MNQNTIDELPKLDTENFENIFNVYQNESGYYYYNLLETIVFPKNLPPNLFTTYIIAPGDTWPYISYKAFNTPNLWWLILKANDIANPLAKLEIGKPLLIPIYSVVQDVLANTSRLKN